MTAVSFKVTKKMDLEEWKDHCWGSGWTTWEWWYIAAVTDEGVLASWFIDVDDPEPETMSGFLTFQEIADACSELAAKDAFVAAQLANDDFDADGMDRVMQYAFIGEVMYG